MKALSVINPWAVLLASGAKICETRSWGVSYRGLVAIHASLRWDAEDRDLCRQAPFSTALDRAGYRRPTIHSDYTLPMGAILAVATLHHVGRIYQGQDGQTHIEGWERAITGDELEFGNYESGRYGWVFSFVRPLIRPLPCRGNRGLWNVPREIVDRMGLVGVE